MLFRCITKAVRLHHRQVFFFSGKDPFSRFKDDKNQKHVNKKTADQQSRPKRNVATKNVRQHSHSDAGQQSVSDRMKPKKQGKEDRMNQEDQNNAKDSQTAKKMNQMSNQPEQNSVNKLIQQAKHNISEDQSNTRPNQRENNQSVQDNISEINGDKVKIDKNRQNKNSEEQKWWQLYNQQLDRSKKNREKNLKNEPIISSEQGQEQKKKDQEPKKNQYNQLHPYFRLIYYVLGGLVVYFLNNFSPFLDDYFRFEFCKEVSNDFLIEALNSNEITKTWVKSKSYMIMNYHKDIKIRNNYIFIKTKNDSCYKCCANNQFEEYWKLLLEQYNQQNTLQQRQYEKEQMPYLNLQTEKQLSTASPIRTAKIILGYVVLGLFINMIRKRSKNPNISELIEVKKSHRFKSSVNVKFKDVMGMQKAKEQIVQFIDFLTGPEKYHALGARIPKGALLTGPPGTGKTMIAKACAGQSNVPFFTISGSEFIEMYAGVGAQRVRELFDEAKKSAPSIIFIDQIDAIGKKRSSAGLGGGHDERDTTLNQLLIEMDGFNTNNSVVVFAATNQKEVLDPALTRPGRFDRLIEVDLPDIEGRREIFQVHLKPIALDQNYPVEEYARRMATLTPGFSGADIRNLCNQAAINAARQNRLTVTMRDFEMANQRIIGGVQRKSTLITPQTRRIVAYHECGHGVVSWFMEHASPLLKLTIIPRSKGVLGFAQYLPTEHRMSTKDKLLDQICVTLGGRISEEVFFNKVSTGAEDDLNKAHNLAKQIVSKHGFGQLGWFRFKETDYAREYSGKTANLIDRQILNIISKCTVRTRLLVEQHKDLIEQLALKLLQQETIDQITIESILGERPFKLSKEHEQYVNERKRSHEKIEQVKLPDVSAEIQQETKIHSYIG